MHSHLRVVDFKPTRQRVHELVKLAVVAPSCCGTAKLRSRAQALQQPATCGSPSRYTMKALHLTVTAILKMLHPCQEQTTQTETTPAAAVIAMLKTRRSGLQCDTMFTHCITRLCRQSPFGCLQGPDIPFEQLLQQKQEGGLLPKGSAAQRHSSSHSYSKVAKRDFKRENKNRPIEQSSKRPVPRHRQVVEMRNR